MAAEHSDLYISLTRNIRSGFGRNLITYLYDKGFQTSEDNPDEIDSHKYFIVVLSKDYPDSWDQLDELVKITEAKGLLILPVFYHVEPSDVRWQTGDYGQTLAAHRESVENERFDRWIKAMKILADIVGLHVKRRLGEDETEHFDEIYQKLSQHVVCTVGLHRREQEVMKVMRPLHSGSDVGVCIAGICGVPGIGKSTLARRVHHCSSKEFPHHYFIDNAGEQIKTHGLRSLLSKLVGDANFDVTQVLKQNKFFFTFEDVDDPEPLKSIIELTNMLGCGSKVVITAKDYHLLQIHGIENIYKVERFDNLEAYELLSLKILKSKQIHVNYVSIIQRLAAVATNLPLLLEVMGSNMTGKSKRECELLLAEYESFPDEETGNQKKLQVSFNTLEDCARKKLIYIARHLIGNKLKNIEDNLHSVFGGCPKEDLKVLRDKSLMKINEDDEVILHDLTLDMIKEIS